MATYKRILLKLSGESLMGEKQYLERSSGRAAAPDVGVAEILLRLLDDGGELLILQPVSYTHLDVYKRQR